MQYLINPLKQKFTSLHTASAGCGGCLLLLLLLLFGLVIWGSHLTSSHTHTVAPARKAIKKVVHTRSVAKDILPSPVPKPTIATTHIFSGTKSGVTYLFDTGANWHLVWSCDPHSDYGYAYHILINVMNADGSIFDYGAVDTTCENGNTSGDITEPQGGYVYLAVTTNGSWQTQIEEMPK